jgi:hypothetical protein
MIRTGMGMNTAGHQVRPLRALQLVDSALDQRSDELGFPATHRRARERVLMQLAVHLMFGFIQLEDGGAIQRTNDRLVDTRAAGRIVVNTVFTASNEYAENVSGPSPVFSNNPISDHPGYTAPVARSSRSIG